MRNPVVSVIVPVKNSARTLESCLQSIKEQTYKSIELVVVDNSSTDTTKTIARAFTKHVYNRGPERSTQRNFGVDKATGDYVCIIDSDMNLSANVISDCVNAIEKNEQIAGVIIPEESFGQGFWAQCKRLERSFYVGVNFMEGARFFRRKDYIKIGGYDESVIGIEDWDLSQRMEKLGTLGRIQSYIFHDEGRLSLRRTVQKKYYYAQHSDKYKHQNIGNKKVGQQTGIVGRYWLFFSHPIRLFRNPVIGVGMLFMKTCEFGFGAAGYLKAKLARV